MEDNFMFPHGLIHYEYMPTVRRAREGRVQDVERTELIRVNTTLAFPQLVGLAPSTTRACVNAFFFSLLGGLHAGDTTKHEGLFFFRSQTTE